MNCSRSLSTSGARTVGAASIVRVVVAAVFDVIVAVASAVRLLLSGVVKLLVKTAGASIAPAAAVLTLLFPLTPIVVVGCAVEQFVESGSDVLTLSSAGCDALAFLVLALVVSCAIGCVIGVLDVVTEVLLGSKVDRDGAAVAAADDACPASVDFSVSSTIDSEEDAVDGEETDAFAPVEDQPIHHDQKMKKRVAFGPVLVREHKVIFGMGSCDGEVDYPLTLDWSHSETTVFDLNDHEESQKLKAPMFEDPKKTRSRVLNTEERIERLCQVGDCRRTTLELAEWQRIEREKQLREELARMELDDDEDEELERKDEEKKVSKVKLEALVWKEECRLQRQFQESLRMELGELKEEDEEEAVDEVEVVAKQPASRSRSVKKPSVCLTLPVRRSHRLSNKPRINYRE